MIRNSTIRIDNEFWGCGHCDFKSKYQSTVGYHVESKHYASAGVQCEYCSTICPTRQALKMHCSRKHRAVSQHWLKNCEFQIWKIWSTVRLKKPQTPLAGFVLTAGKHQNGKLTFWNTLREPTLSVLDITVMSVVGSVRPEMLFGPTNTENTKFWIKNYFDIKLDMFLFAQAQLLTWLRRRREVLFVKCVATRPPPNKECITTWRPDTSRARVMNVISVESFAKPKMLCQFIKQDFIGNKKVQFLLLFNLWISKHQLTTTHL